ncbi:MAG TPA: hypothetical protein VFC23_10155 [Thermoanaerobaculia bacterium]|nr:hypothetical protein [Thermoanaerobaculia bacterium]
MNAKRTLAVTLGLTGTSIALRPWFMRWGAEGWDSRRTWPGDELSPRPLSVATRAITIHAPASRVWPWILQIGQDRGGFYSYTWLENLVGARMKNADRILPEAQERKVGDTVWMAPKERYGEKASMRVAILEPERAMVLIPPGDFEKLASTGEAPGGTWALFLEPVDASTTRLVVRSRGPRKPGLGEKIFRTFAFDPAHFIMERRMMLGIKRRAEAAPVP